LNNNNTMLAEIHTVTDRATNVIAQVVYGTHALSKEVAEQAATV